MNEFFISNDIDYVDDYIKIKHDFLNDQEHKLTNQEKKDLDNKLERLFQQYNSTHISKPYVDSVIISNVSYALDKKALNPGRVPYILLNELYDKEDKIRLLSLFEQSVLPFEELDEVLIDLLSSIEYETEEELKIKDSFYKKINMNSKNMYMLLTRVKLDEEERKSIEELLFNEEDEYSYECKFYYKMLNGDEKFKSLFKNIEELRKFLILSDKFHDKELRDEFLDEYKKVETLKIDMEIEQILSNNQNRNYNIEIPRQYINAESKIKIKSDIKFK